MYVLSINCTAQTYIEQEINKYVQFPGVLLLQADFDGDGDLDFLHSRSVVLLEEGQPSETVFWDSSYELSMAFAGDLNMDGLADIVTLLQGMLLVFYNQGAGQFTIEVMALQAAGTVLGLHDVDSDGDLDLMFSTFGSFGFGFYRNDQPQHDWPIHAFTVPDLDPVHVPALTDLNHDGHPEILIIQEESFVWLKIDSTSITPIKTWMKPEEGVIGAIRQIDTGIGELSSIAVINGYSNRVFSCDSSANELTEIVEFNFPEGGLRMNVDINGDGIDDLLKANDDEAFWSLSDGPLNYTDTEVISPSIYGAGWSGNVCKLPAYPGGFSSVAVSNPVSKTVWVYHADGINLVQLPHFYRMLSEVSSLARVDINDDGLEDIIIPNNEKSTFVVLRQKWNGTFEQPEVLFEHERHVTMLNGAVTLSDGSDALYFVFFPGELWKAHISPEGALLSLEMVLSNFDYSDVLQADLDGDGIKDLSLHTESHLNFNSLLVGANGSLHSPQFNTIAFTEPVSEVAALDRKFVDWDDDGDDDYFFLKRNDENRSLELLINQGNFTNLQTHTLIDFGSYEQPLGHLDIARANASEDNWYCMVVLDEQLLVYKLAVQGAELIYQQPYVSSGTVVPSFVRDYNRDGNLDILLPGAMLLSNADCSDYVYQDLNLEQPIKILQALPNATARNYLLAVAMDNRVLLLGLEEGLSLSGSSQKEFVLFPNPASSTIRHDFRSNESISRIRIFNHRSQLVYQSNCQPNCSGSVDISHLPEGLYHYEIYTEQGNYLQKFVVTR